MSVSDVNNDFDVDEHGILREKEVTLEDQGIILDDDGILRDEGDRYSHYTYCTDSGLGTVDRKSSSSTLHKLQGSLNNLTDTHVRATPDNDEILSGKRISDYEVSESIHDEVSYDQVSVGSGYNDLPYYEESYTTDQSRPDYEYGSTTDRSYSRTDYSSDSRAQQRYDRDENTGTDYEASSISFMNSGEFDPKDLKPADEKYRNLYNGSKSPGQPLQNTGNNSSIGYLLGSYKKIQPNAEQDDIESDNIDEEYGISSRYRDSLFSQEETKEPKHTLLEFEVIEAQLKAAEALGNEHDLIGAYLSSVEQQERDEESEYEQNKDDIISVSQQFDKDDLPFEDERSKPDFVPNLQFSDSIVGSQDNDVTIDTELQSTQKSTQSFRAPTPTRIPMWRDRSPSMSRPGSTSPSRNRRLMSEDRDSGFSTYERGRSLTRPSNNRALPVTPNPPSPNSSIPRLRSPSPSQRKSPVTRRKSPINQRKSPANHIDQAVALLVSDSEASQRNSEMNKDLKTIDDKMRSFKIRQSPSPTKREPMKAFYEKKKLEMQHLDSGEETSTTARSEPSKKALTKKLEEEKGHRERENEDYKMLMSEHNRIQEKLALAENTIDELRTGAKITLYSDSPTPQQGQAGTLVGAQQAQTINLGKTGTATLSSIPAQAQRATISNSQGGSRPSSRASQPSERPTSTEIKSSVQSPDPEEPEDMSLALKEQSSKMALLLQGKDLDDKLDAFQTLLEGDHLTADEQRQALINIKQCHDELQKEYQNVKSEHDQERRKSRSKAVFDSNNEVNGELYKLSMKLDGLENRVEQSMQEKSNQRQPFRGPGPVKGDHGVTEGVKEGENLPNGGVVLTNGSRRPPSVSSLAGGASDIDEKLHQLQKDYDNCIHQYRRVKQMPVSSQRDQQVDSLLKQIKKIYEETPDHRKPPLPPELEKMYDGKQGGFIPPEKMNRRSEPERTHRLTKEEIESPRRTTTSSRLRKYLKDPVSNKDIDLVSSKPKSRRHTRSSRDKERKPSEVSTTSDISTPSTRDSRVRIPRHVADDSRASEYISSTSANTTPQTSRRRRGLPSRPSRQSGVNDSSQMAASPGGRSRRGELVDKDSGYVGSTGSKRLPGHQVTRESRRPGAASRYQHLKTSALDDDRPALHGPTTDSDASTVEFRTPRRHVSSSNTKQPTKDGVNRTRRHSYGSGSDSLHRPRSKTPRSHLSESDDMYSSDGSRSTVRSSSAKLKSLEDELIRLKERMDSSGSVQYSQQTAGVPVTVPVAEGPVQYLQQQSGVPLPNDGATLYTNTSVPYVGQDAGVPVAGVGYYPNNWVSGQYSGQPAGWGYGAFVSGPGGYNKHDRYRRRSNSSPPERRPTSPYRSRTKSPYRYQEESPSRRRYAFPNRGEYDEIDERYNGESSRWERGREYKKYNPKDREYNRYSPQDGHYEDYLSDGPEYDNDYDETPDRRYRSMREYYLPTSSQNYPRSSSRGPTYDYDYDNTYPKQYASYPDTQPDHYVGTTNNVCPMCGGVGYHTHEGYVHPASDQLQQQSFSQPAYVSQVPSQPVSVQPSLIQPPPNSASSQTYVPVQVVPMQRSSSTPNVHQVSRGGKVRYYVREYGGESEDERDSRLVKVIKRRPRRVTHQDVYSDGEIEGENLDDSLENAAKTAKALKYLSGKMKNSLLEELNVTYRHTAAMAKLIN